MGDPPGPREDRYFAPGTRVRRDAYWDGEDHLTSEFGIVVHCWLDDEIRGYDCYIAFFGDGLPTGKPTDPPYVLRCASVGLVEVSE